MKKYLLISILILPLALTTNVRALGLIYELDTEFSDGTNPSGSPPWLRATFENVAGGDVKLTLDGLLQGSGEKVTLWAFNFDPNLNAAALGFSVGPHTSPGFTVAVLGNDSYKADGDGFFDIRIEFPTAENVDVFNDNEQAVFFFSYSTDITFNSFNFGSVGGDKGSFGAAAHVQGIGSPTASLSGWIGDSEGTIRNGEVPEPATMLLLGSGLIGLAGYGRKKLFKK